MVIRRENNLAAWARNTWKSTFRQLLYPGLRVSYGGICDCFLFSLFVLPPYFGVRLGFFDLTVFRFFEVLLLLLIWKKKSRRQEFIRMALDCPHTLFIAAYMFVIVYTNLYHPALNEIFYWLMNGVFVFYIVVYLVSTEYGVEGFLRKVHIYTWIITLVSPLELLIKKPPFSFLDTLHKSSHNIRFGVVRIMGNCTTTNGYAMLLCLLLPIICYDYRRRRIDIVENRWLVVLIMVNILLTGSRVSIGMAIFCLVLCLFAQDKHRLLKFLVIGAVVIPVGIGLIYIFREASFVKSLLLSAATMIDEIFKTSLSVSLGADANVLYNSSHYRDLLVSGTFGSNWLNPLLGRGGGYNVAMYIEGYSIYSVDNFYVGQYIYYAYPGVVTWLVMSASFLVSALWNFFISREYLLWALSVGTVGYFISLWYLDQLGTFPIMLAFFGLTYCVCRNLKEQRRARDTEGL